MLKIITRTLGPVATNVYLIADPETKEAAVIDPAWDGDVILAEAQKQDWHITQLWYTHAHFDHFGGAAAIAAGCNPVPAVALHPDDQPLWQIKGGAQLFGIPLDDPVAMVSADLREGQGRGETCDAPSHHHGADLGCTRHPTRRFKPSC